MSMHEAEQDFVHKLEMSAKDKVSEDKTEILIPAECFVITLSEKAHEERVSFGLKHVKNPTQDKIDEYRDYMGTDHQSFAALARGLGMEPESVRDHMPNHNARTSAPNDPAKLEEARKAK